MVAPRAEEKGLALATLVGPDTPDTVLGDPVRLRQILACTVQLSAADSIGPPDPSLSGLRVLVAHQQPLVAESIRRQLARWGAEVFVGGEVGPPFDLVLVDARSTAAVDVAAGVITVAGLSDRAPAHGRYVVRTPVRRAPLREAVLAALGRPTGTDPARSSPPPTGPTPDRTPDLALN
jgi:hypothetical protein